MPHHTFLPLWLAGADSAARYQPQALDDSDRLRLHQHPKLEQRIDWQVSRFLKTAGCCARFIAVAQPRRRVAGLRQRLGRSGCRHRIPQSARLCRFGRMVLQCTRTAMAGARRLAGRTLLPLVVPERSLNQGRRLGVSRRFAAGRAALAGRRQRVFVRGGTRVARR